jgi:hypothetical protein
MMDGEVDAAMSSSLSSLLLTLASLAFLSPHPAGRTTTPLPSLRTEGPLSVRPSMTSALVTPGEPLFPSSTHASGPGTHVRGGSVCASVVGVVVVGAGADGQV